MVGNQVRETQLFRLSSKLGPLAHLGFVDQPILLQLVQWL